MRFVDSVRAYGVWVDDESIYGGKPLAETTKYYDDLLGDALSSINFDIQSVVELLQGDAISGWWDSSFAPPFDRMILEYSSAGYLEQVAIFAKVRDVVKAFDKPEVRLAAARLWWRSVTDGVAYTDEGPHPLLPFEQARWLVTLHMFTKGEGFKNFRAPIGRACFALDGEGRPLRDGGTGFALDMWISDAIVRHVHLLGPSSDLDADEKRRYDVAGETLQLHLVQPFMATMALLNTKNVETREILPSRQQRRDAERRRLDPPVTYRELTVAVPGVDRSASGRRNAQSLANAPLHIVRGHLARYGPEFGRGKLFGKYEGQFWVPAHVRGSAEAGKVVKDYKVKAPKVA